MASIRKKGTGYEIRITDGYDSTGKQITISRMFKPKETWSEKKALSEARKFADSLENRMKNGENLDSDKLTLGKDQPSFPSGYAAAGTGPYYLCLVPQYS